MRRTHRCAILMTAQHSLMVGGLSSNRGTHWDTSVGRIMKVNRSADMASVHENHLSYVNSGSVVYETVNSAPLLAKYQHGLFGC